MKNNCGFSIEKAKRYNGRSGRLNSLYTRPPSDRVYEITKLIPQGIERSIKIQEEIFEKESRNRKR
jgi:hypothetical protein